MSGPRALTDYDTSPKAPPLKFEDPRNPAALMPRSRSVGLDLMAAPAIPSVESGSPSQQ